MKKLLIAVFLVLILVGGQNKNFSLSQYVKGSYYAYTQMPSSESQEAATKYYITTQKPKDYKNIVGEMVVVENFNPKKLLKSLNAEIVLIKQEKGCSLIYATSKKIPKQCNENGLKFNLQIATKNDKSYIGWPKLLESF